MKTWIYIGVAAVVILSAIAARMILLPIEDGGNLNDDIATLPLATQDGLGLREVSESNNDGSVRHIYIGDKIPDSELVDVSPEEEARVHWLRVDTRTDYSSSENVIWTHTSMFENLNPFAIAEIEVNMKIKTPGVKTYQTTIHYTRFYNGTIPTMEELYPFETCNFSNPAKVIYPLRFWRTDTEFEWKITRVRRYKKPYPQNTILGIASLLFTSENQEEAIAVLEKNPELVKLKDKDSGVNTTLLAFWLGNEKVIKYVLSHGGDIKSVDRTGAGVLHYAARGLDYPALDIALAAGIDPNAKSLIDWTPLHYAARAGMHYHIPKLIAKGADPNALTNNGDSPGQFATLIYNSHVMEALIKNGASKEYTTRGGYTYLSQSLRNVEFLEKLVNLGLSMEFKSPMTGETALLSAAHYGDKPAAEWLLKHGADEKAVDRNGKDIFELAKESNTLKTDRFFREMYDRVKAEMARK